MKIPEILKRIDKYATATVPINEKTEERILYDISSITPEEEKQYGKVVFAYNTIFNVIHRKHNEMGDPNFGIYDSYKNMTNHPDRVSCLYGYKQGLTDRIERQNNCYYSSVIEWGIYLWTLCVYGFARYTGEELDLSEENKKEYNKQYETMKKYARFVTVYYPGFARPFNTARKLILTENAELLRKGTKLGEKMNKDIKEIQKYIEILAELRNDDYKTGANQTENLIHWSEKLAKNPLR